MVFLLCVVTLPTAVAQALAGQFNPAAASLVTAGLLFASVCSLRVTGSARISANLLVLVGLSSIVYMAALTGGAGSAALYWTAGLPILAVAVGRPVDAAIWGVIATVLIVGFLFLHDLGWSPAQRVDSWSSPSVLAFSQIGLVAFVAGLAATFEASREQTISALERKNRELEVSRRNALEADEAKTRFLATVSHELRTPLSSVLGFAEVLRTRISPSSREGEYLSIIHESGAHLKNLVDDLLDLRRIEQGILRVNRTASAVGGLIAESVRSIRRDAEARGVRIEVSISPSAPVRFSTDRTRFRQILTHLLDHAVISAPNNGRVKLDVSSVLGVPGSLVLEAQHDGAGPSEEELMIALGGGDAEVAFGSIQAGSGFGLAVAQRISTTLGGVIDVRSGKGQAAFICCTLWPVESGSLGTVESEPELGSPLPSMAGTRILVADDNPTTRLLVGVMLENLGVEVVEAADGRAAVNAVMEATPYEAFDALILDIQMPELDGRSAVRELRKRGCTTPAIALTAAAMPEERDRCLTAGFEAFATKPIDRSFLIALLRGLIIESPPARPVGSH